MKHRRNRKTRRKIELIVKTGIFVCIMIVIMTPKKPLPAHDLSTENTAENSSDNTNDTLLIPIQGLSQEGIPTGCESVSTVALLQYLGVEIIIDEFIESFLPCKGFYRKNETLYGPDPNEYFAGNPYEKASLGCYPDVILKALREMKNLGYPGMENLNFRNVSGTDLETLVTHYITDEHPVLLWVTINMKEPSKGMQYYLEDGTLYTWTAQEHCVVLCGYDENDYYLMDPLANGDIVNYPKELVEKRYNEMQKNAVVVF